MRYAWIESHRRQYPVSLSCQVLGVSPSGYHGHRRRDTRDAGRPRRGVSNDALLVHIRAIHAQSKGEYGWPGCGRNCWSVVCAWARSAFAS